jgi:hypothetical protein
MFYCIFSYTADSRDASSLHLTVPPGFHPMSAGSYRPLSPSSATASDALSVGMTTAWNIAQPRGATSGPQQAHDMTRLKKVLDACLQGDGMAAGMRIFFPAECPTGRTARDCLSKAKGAVSSTLQEQQRSGSIVKHIQMGMITAFTDLFIYALNIDLELLRHLAANLPRAHRQALQELEEKGICTIGRLKRISLNHTRPTRQSRTIYYCKRVCGMHTPLGTQEISAMDCANALQLDLESFREKLLDWSKTNRREKLSGGNVDIGEDMTPGYT